MLSLRIAIRYLFAAKSHRAINAITVVAACGVAVITAALICILSVFNGFDMLVGTLTSRLDPELKVVPTQGKFFADTDSLRTLLLRTDGIEALSATLDEDILIINSGRQVPARMKGVDSQYQQVTQIDSILWSGQYLLETEGAPHLTVMGIGLAQQVATRPGYLHAIQMFCPRREGKIDLLNPADAFQECQAICSGIFVLQQADYDDRICLVSIEAARQLLSDSTLCSAFDLRLCPGVSADRVQQQLNQQLAPYGLTTLNRQQQQADNYRIVQIEKWITFCLILFILLIASFNLVGSLSMLIIDKQAEIQTLRHMGADRPFIRRIFLYEGALVSGIGAGCGLIIGILLCWLQQTFGIIGLGDGSSLFVVDAYPVQLQATDILFTLVAITATLSLSILYVVRSSALAHD